MARSSLDLEIAAAAAELHRRVSEAEAHGADYQAARQRYLRGLLDDPAQPRFVRGWVRQELNRLARIRRAGASGQRAPGGDRSRLKGVPGTDVGHRPGFAGLHAPQNFRLEDPRFNRARPNYWKHFTLPSRYREFEQQLEIASHEAALLLAEPRF